jgi:hypothetical protein
MNYPVFGFMGYVPCPKQHSSQEASTDFTGEVKAESMPVVDPGNRT